MLMLSLNFMPERGIFTLILGDGRIKIYDRFCSLEMKIPLPSEEGID